MGTVTTGELPPIEVVDEVGSTNVEVMARGRAGAPHGSALRARVQTAGRGQRAHVWTSPAGGLYLSVLVRPRVSGEMLPGLPIACALGALSALRAAGCPAAMLKWPNDVVVGSRKLAGILTELAVSPDGAFAVCGVGVNMRAPALPRRDPQGGPGPLDPTGLIDEIGRSGAPEPLLPGISGDLVSEGGAIDLDVLAEGVRRGILDAVADWERSAASAPGVGTRGPLDALLDPYHDALAFLGERVRVHAIDGAELTQGVFKGVDANGLALVEGDDGSIVPYDSSCASIRPVPPVAGA